MTKIIPPKGFTQLIIKSHLLKICKRNQCAAILLDLFDNAANGSKDEIEIGLKSLRKCLLGAYSKNNVIKSLKELKSLNLIEIIHNVSDNGGYDCNGYIVNYDEVFKALLKIS